MNYLYCGLGIAAVGAGVYFLFKNLMSFIPIALLLVGTFLAVKQVESGQGLIETIIIYGLIVGVLSVPSELVDELETLRKKVNELVEKILGRY